MNILHDAPIVKPTEKQSNAIFDEAHRNMMSHIHIKYPLIQATWEWNHNGSILFYWLRPRGIAGKTYIAKHHKNIIKDLKAHTPIFMNVEYAFACRVGRGGNSGA